MPDTDWGEIADERFNDELDFSKIESKQDYIMELTKFLNKSPQGKAIISGAGKIPNDALNRMYETSSAKDKVGEAESLIEAQKFQKSRGRRGRVDARRTAKDTRRPSRTSVRRWRRSPNRSDIRGVDTKIMTKRMNMITKSDRALKDVNVIINIRGIKQYRDNKGRYIKRPS